MSANYPKTAGLCAATYRAQQVPGAVLIFADGYHSTSGYNVFFELSPIDIFPPQFSLWHATPSGMVLDVITPFTEYTSFKASGKVETVVVFDINGKHEVPVEQVPDVVVNH